MKKNFKWLVLLGILVSAPAAFSQIRYVPGYLIGNDGVKQDVWVLDRDQMNNPSDFTYKMTEDGAPRLGALEKVREFGVGDVRFRRYQADVPVLVSNFYTYDPSLQYERDTLYLRVLAETEDVLLLGLSKGNLNWYYYAEPDDELATLLVHKEYLKTERMKGQMDNNRDYLHHNNQFRNQILTLLHEQGITERDVENARYTRQDLVKVWEKASGRSQAKNGSRRLNPGLFVSGGVARYYVGNVNTRSVIRSIPTYGAGLDLEFVFPFSKEKLAIGFSPQFQRMYAPSAPTLFSVENGTPDPNETSSVDVRFIEIPLSLRYRMYVSKNSWLYLKSGVGYFQSLQSRMAFPVYRSREELTMTEGMDFFVGTGCCFKRHLGIEMAYKAHSHSTKSSWAGSRPVAREAVLGLYWSF